MKKRLPVILPIFSALFLFLFAGCATGQKAYDGPKLPDEEIARIICKSRPVAIEAMWAKAGTGQFTKRGWRVDPGFGATSWTLKVLPGNYLIKFQIPNPPYDRLPLSHTVTVEAGRVYSIECYAKSKRCSMSDVTSK